MTEAELNELTLPYLHHVENCRNCKADIRTGNFTPCAKAVEMVEEIGRKAQAVKPVN